MFDDESCQQGGMRQRKNASQVDSSDSLLSNSFVESLKEMDFYPKTEDQHVVQTELGGISTIKFSFHEMITCLLLK
jgi:hypothetical protein